MGQSPSVLQDARNSGIVPSSASTSSASTVYSSPVPSSASTSSASTVYSSPRIERMRQTRSTFGTHLEYEIESSKDHWSEVAPLSDDSVSQDPQAFFEQGIFAGEKCTESELEYVRDVCDASLDSETREDQLMRMLSLRWASRFDHYGYSSQKWEVGRKIGEGAQAEIFEVNPNQDCPDCHNKGLICRNFGIPRHKYILKVFKEGYRVRDLQRLWPKQVATGYSTLYTCPVRCGYLLPNGRFAFLMPRYWGDLRKLLDRRMQQRLDCTHPPCSDWEATRSMLYIAKGMRDLHISNIVHGDLKASNVLVEMIERSKSEMEKIRNKDVDTFYCRVADFESSKGVLGTGFWRAPEILIGVKNRCVTPDLFTKASDVYSYAMTCYEIWTGCFPFENLKTNEYDVVLGGERPILPSGMKPWIREMLERCWHADPSKRPTFQEICDTITNYSQDTFGKCMDGIEEKEFDIPMKSSDLNGHDCQWIVRLVEMKSFYDVPKRLRGEQETRSVIIPPKWLQRDPCLCEECFPKWSEEFIIQRVKTRKG
ncbi:hypothetical protein M758_3G260400 [Ceratodon purpureus]|nr:hypothetical protein M758_3G260400 [Ceratodon purpureus]